MNPKISTTRHYPLPEEGGRAAPGARRLALRGAMPARAVQRGAALMVALILLIVITLVGLAAIGTTILQNRATANQYDRQIAFQSAEAAMRVAAAVIPGNVARNCQTASITCQANPFDEEGSTLPAGSIYPVSAGSADATEFTVGTNAPMQPQYVIESMGEWDDASENVGCSQSANSKQYMQQCGGQVTYYRITARSCDPSSSNCDNRSIVTLQSVIKQE